MRCWRYILVVGLLALTGCGVYPTVPDLGLATPERDAALPWPNLRPTRDLIALKTIDTSQAQRGIASLEARATALRNRARRLQQPLIDQRTKARMLRLMNSAN